MFRGKNIWIIPLISALLVGGVAWWADGRLHRVIEQDLKESLQSALDANVTSLEIWMDLQKRISTSWAEDPSIRSQALDALTRSTSTPTNRFLPGERFGPQPLANGNLAERARSLGYQMVQLVNTNLLVISENGRTRGRLGQPVPEVLIPKYEELFATGEPRIITPFKVPRPSMMWRGGPREAGGRETGSRFGMPPGPMGFPGPTNRLGRFAPLLRDPAVMQVAAPIKNDASKILGALVLVFSPNAEFTRFLSVASYGESGETFAFDGEGVLLSESRFDDELKRLGLLEKSPDAVSALNLRLLDPESDLREGGAPVTNGPLILMVERALEGGSGVEIKPFRDYRGVPVVGAWQWLPKYGFGVGMKMDASEGFQLLRMVRSVFLVLFLLLLLGSVLLFVFSYMQVRVRRRLTEVELKARQLGQYRLVEKIGEGGMGSVYKARHALLRRETALKLLPPDKADDFSIRRFEQEVQLTCTLTHPNTIQVFDYGHTPDGIFYYAMEYLDGLNLADLVGRYGPQPEDRVIHILRQVCDSLTEAHQRGLIHRDIKPANIFLCDRGGVADSVKVLDFGLVRHFGANASAANLPEFAGPDGIVGTPNFIAPEAISNPDAADARSDLYSVGAVAYYLLTGRYVFEDASIAEVCRRHLNEAPETPSHRAGHAFDPALETLVLRCLSKNPADRPQSAEEVAAQLARCQYATSWTLERRTEWWAQHRRSPVQPPAGSRLKTSTLERTVKIDLGERTA